MTTDNFWKSRVQEGAVLNPLDIISEVLFGLIMVLTFTGARSVATEGRQEIRELLWAALGGNVAWGLVDAIMYMMNVLAERGHGVVVYKKILTTKATQDVRSILRREIQPMVSALLTDNELDNIGERLKKLPEPTRGSLISGRDLWSCVQIFLLVFLCTFPVALPFALFEEVAFALRASNGVALLMLFVGGWFVASYAGFRRIGTAVVYALIGVLLVAMTMALGG
jgi:hypothetical protein